MKGLPEGFYIGAATAAHQVEGGNIHSDYWAMEHMEHTSFAEPSADAVDHYHRYEEDIRLMAEAGLNAYRFSVEWARIEPEKGKFDEAEIEHYGKVLDCCIENGIEPVVTLHHFSSPKWLIEQGGWEAEETIGCFARYAGYVAEKLGDRIHYICTINEANMGLQIAAVMARYMAQMKAAAENASGDNTDGEEGKVQVGLNLQGLKERIMAQKKENVCVFGTDTPQVFVAGRTPEGDRLVMKAHQAAKEWEEEFLHYLPYIKEDDFFGLQNYTRSVYGPDGVLPCEPGAKLTQMDYEYYPEALEHVIRAVHEKLPIPIFVTENGIAASEDADRISFIRTALEGVEKCVADGIPVKGYLYWSLLDNFEWQKGFSMTFGLVAVDRGSMERKPKESLRFLGQYTTC